MRILVITDSYYPSRSACAVRMKVIVETLLDCGNDVEVLASDSSLDGASEAYVKPDYVHFFPVVSIGNKSIINRLKNNLAGTFGAVKAARQLDYFDIVFVTSPPLLITLGAVKVARLKHAKLVLDVRDIWPDVGIEMGSFSKRGPFALFFNIIANHAYRRSRLITTVSQGKVKKIRERISARQAGKVQIIANGIDNNFVCQKEDPAIVSRFNLNSLPICVYVGNIGLAQGLESLLLLARERPDVRFLLFGDGASKKKLENIVEKEGLHNVSFCGLLDSRGVFTVLRHSTVSYVPLVNSNLSDSIPTKMFEAIACGCPVLLVAKGESVSVLRDIGLGVSVPPEETPRLTDALNKMLDKPFADEERNRAAEYVLKQYSRQVEAKKLNILFQEL